MDAVCSAPAGLPVRAAGGCGAALAGREGQQNRQRAHALAGVCGGELELFVMGSMFSQHENRSESTVRFFPKEYQ